ncbi:MAG: DUF3306 domain-containing protein [Hyphomicrobiaceae bacterium]|nr:DUF3306 domain-containing protein [Hyphomicrobiaceae bacterium]
MPTSSDESFFARWSRLKQDPATRDGATTVPVGPHGDVEPGRDRALADGAPRNEESGCDVNAEAGDGVTGGGGAAGGAEEQARSAEAVPDFSQIDFEALTFDSDYTQFMGKNVPRDVQNKALRQLWLSNPVLANMDGLDDYCEDYTDAAMVPVGGIKTAYRIGKGFLSDSEVAEWEKLGRPAEKVVAEADADAADAEAVLSSESGEVVALADDVAVGEAGDTGSASALTDEAGCPGAACAAAVKQEEQAALDAYDRAEASSSQDGGADGTSRPGGEGLSTT